MEEGLYCSVSANSWNCLAWEIPWTEDPVVLPGVANVAGNPPGAQQGQGKTWRRGSAQRHFREGNGEFPSGWRHQSRTLFVMAHLEGEY